MLRRNNAGRMLMARIYQPKGQGPFPTVLDLHGGARNQKDRFAEEPMDRVDVFERLLGSTILPSHGELHFTQP
jgi:poly(3-hydroxybutyrate) depolymerase